MQNGIGVAHVFLLTHAPWAETESLNQYSSFYLYPLSTMATRMKVLDLRPDIF